MPDIGFDFSLKINGTEIAPEIRDHLAKLEYEESLTDTAHLDIEIKDCEFFNLKRRDFDLRVPLRVPVEFSLGYLGKLTWLFGGDIVKVDPQFSAEGTSTLSIVCQDVSARMKREPKPFIYEVEKFPNAAVIARHLISKYGLEPVLSPEKQLRAWEEKDKTTQISTTDWELLSGLAENLHFRLFARGTKVYLVDDNYLSQQQEAKWTFIQRADRSDLAAPATAPLLAFKPGLTSRGQRVKCEVLAWSSVDAQGQHFKGEADLKDVYGDGKVFTDISVATEVDETLHIRGKAATSTQMAHELAMSYLRARADRLVTGDGKIPGNAAIRAGSKHTFVVRDLGDFGKEFSGDYWITGVRHIVSPDAGFETQFDVRRDGLTVV